MDSSEAVAQKNQADFNGALQDPSLAFGDATSVALARAADGGDTAQVRALIAQGGRLDVHGIKDITLLQWEILHGSVTGVRTLMDAGADASQRGLDGRTGLSEAAAYGGPDYVRVMLDHHADPNATDDGGNTPLIDGMLGDSDESLYMLVRAGADVNRRGALGYTPLMSAAVTNSYARLLWLLRMGADPRATVQFSIGPPKSFQTYLNGTPRTSMSAEGKQGVQSVDDWLSAHNVPLEPSAQ